MYIKHYICFYNCSVYRDNSVKARQKHFLAWQVIVSFLEFCIGVEYVIVLTKLQKVTIIQSCTSFYYLFN